MRSHSNHFILQSELFGQIAKLSVLCVGNSVLPAVLVKTVLYVYLYASRLVLVALSEYTLSHLRIKFCLSIRGQGGKKFDLLRITTAENK